MPLSKWVAFHRRLGNIKDGTANTILVGSRALATNVYNIRGCSNFTISSNGTTQSCNDDPITNPGPGVMGTLRAIGPDDTWWTAGNSSDPVAGNSYTLAPGWVSWFPGTFAVVQDKRDLDSWNRWGSPYSGGAPIAMCDGGVRIFSYSTSPTIILALCTPNGGEVANVD
jgi:hypothetical protein